VRIELPALRERGEDVLLLAHHLLGKHGSRLGKSGMRFAAEALEALAGYEFPGNIRELENAIERAAIMTHGELVTLEALPPQLQPRSTGSSSRLRAAVELSLSFNEARQRFERTYIDQVLEESGGNLSQAARRSGMDRSNFRRLLERHGVRGAANVA
jgi:two-component system response regulator GlrR